MSTRYPAEPQNQFIEPQVHAALKNPVAGLQFTYNSIPSDRVKWLDESVPVDAVAWASGEPSPLSVAWGTLDYAEVTANQGPITTEVDLTGLTVTVTVGTSRRIQVTGSAHVTNAADASSTGLIYEDAVNVGRWHRNNRFSAIVKSEGSVVLTPTAGSHTYKLTMLSTGTGATLGAGAALPAFILVQDIGPA